jgi:hypothetical protein
MVVWAIPRKHAATTKITVKAFSRLWDEIGGDDRVLFFNIPPLGMPQLQGIQGDPHGCYNDSASKREISRIY